MRTETVQKSNIRHSRGRDCAKKPIYGVPAPPRHSCESRNPVKQPPTPSFLRKQESSETATPTPSFLRKQESSETATPPPSFLRKQESKESSKITKPQGFPYVTRQWVIEN